MRTTRSAALALVVLGVLGAAATAASPAPAGEGTAFRSTTYPYAMTLPPGWTDVTVDGSATGDLFSGPGGASGRMGTRGPVPGQRVADRVAANRAELEGQGCASDPAADRATTLGGEEAIEWSFSCTDTVTAVRNTIHDGIGYRLSVTTPGPGDTAARDALALMASAFRFTDAPASPAPPADLAAIDAALQGTWQTEWAATELWLASVRAAGLDPDDLEGFSDELRTSDQRRETLRFQGDQLVEFVAVDGGPDTIGSQQSYRLVDADTIEMTSPDGVYRTVIDIDLQGDLLFIDAISDTDPLAVIPQTSIFETLPFRRVP